ncbi:MAG: hypothetical protein KAS32_18720 [Candidatus Peribacteraceae bacterium]|nr:hypothetical protein [Candidatus Peribacteraceae bacterium]
MKVNTKEIVQQIISSYDHIFGDGTALIDIQTVLSALEHKQPILDLLEGGRFSFSTIFIPFHAGTITSNGVQFRQLNLPPSCCEFMENCAVIESLTDKAPAWEIEPDEKTRNELLRSLHNFLDHFPSKEDVLSWKK